jgi:hypothetical protein
MIGVIVLLQIRQLNTAFFNFVYRIYEVFGVPRGVSDAGYQLFKFWLSPPL